MLRDRRTILSLGLGLLGCLMIWVAVPYNNFVLNNSFISDGYLPEIVLLLLAVLVVGLNPLLRRWRPDCVLEHRHLAFITGMLLFAAVLPSNGLFRFFPHCLALDTQKINESRELAPAIANSALPSALFPDKIGLDVATPVSNQLIDELNPGATIPWAAWVVPLLAWGTLIVAFWVLMIGLGLMVFPQWLHVERLPFPLLRVYQAILGEPTADRTLPPLFRSRLFWIGCGVVFLIHSTNGLAIFTDGAFPAFPVSWDISNIFTEGVWREAPGFLKGSRLYFLFIGLAFVMPNRYSFSIWFTVLAFGLFLMVAAVHWPAFDPTRLYDQGCGALIAMAIGVVWLGRQHYWQTLCATFDRGGTGDAWAGRLFLGGGAVMLGWFVWAGAGWIWSLVFVVVAIMIMLMVARIVAETGMTYIWILPLTVSRLVGLFPEKWTSVATAFLQEAHYILVNRASAVSVAVMTMLALGLQPTSTPQSRHRVAGVGVVILVLGLLLCGAVHLDMGYRFASSLDGVNTPITGRGAQLLSLGPVLNVVAGRESSLAGGQIRLILWGGALAGGLLFLCGRFPSWPLHPIGLIFVYSSLGQRLFMSLFLGWLIKTMLMQIGGARGYRVALPLFLGLIFGEVFANALWTLVPVLQILFGADPATVRHMIIFQYG